MGAVQGCQARACVWGGGVRGGRQGEEGLQACVCGFRGGRQGEEGFQGCRARGSLRVEEAARF